MTKERFFQVFHPYFCSHHASLLWALTCGPLRVGVCDNGRHNRTIFRNCSSTQRLQDEEGSIALGYGICHHLQHSKGKSKVIFYCQKELAIAAEKSGQRKIYYLST